MILVNQSGIDKYVGAAILETIISYLIILTVEDRLIFLRSAAKYITATVIFPRSMSQHKNRQFLTVMAAVTLVSIHFCLELALHVSFSSKQVHFTNAQYITTYMHVYQRVLFL